LDGFENDIFVFLSLKAGLVYAFGSVYPC